MKIIDLLNKIANGKEVPKNIIYNGYNYHYHTDRKGYYRSVVGSNWIALTTDFSLCTILNDEVEILEEEKKIPEKLYLSDYEDTTGKFDYDVLLTINEIIDYLKSKGE